MARYKKAGLDYFPVNVDIESDDKLMMIEANYGLVGFAVILKLYAKIYKEYGYYYQFRNREASLFAKKQSISKDQVDKIVESAIEERIFDRDIFEKYEILTSKGIQARYFDAIKRRNEFLVFKEILLIDIKYAKFHEDKIQLKSI